MMAKAIAFHNALLALPGAKSPKRGDLLVQGGKIAALGAGLFVREKPPAGAEQIACEGALLLPGVMDMHVYAPNVGADHRESMESLSQAALAGGVSDVLLIPDGNAAAGGSSGGLQPHHAAALTRDLAGEGLAEMHLALEAGAVAFSNGRKAVAHSQVMRRAMGYAAALGKPVLHHVEAPDLAGEGVMHEGALAAQLGLAGIPAEAETIMLARDIALARLTGVKYHAQQISSAASLEIIRRAKQEGLPISCGTSIHHLLLDETGIGLWRTHYKLSPPLRGRADRLALVEGLKEGLIDVIVSAHDPQDEEAKRLPFASAKAGAVGVETLLPAALALCEQGVALGRLLDALITRPAAILGLPARTLAVGQEANLVLCRQESFPLEAATLHARCKNTPLDGLLLHGRVLLTLIKGKVIEGKSHA